MPKILEKTKVSLPEDIIASLRCNYEALKQKHTHLHGQYSTLHKQHLAANCLKLNAQLQHETELRRIHENFKAFKVNLKRDLELKYGKVKGDFDDDDDGTNLSQLSVVVDHQFRSGTEHQEENETIPHLIHEWSTENTTTEAHEGIYPQEMNGKEFQFSPERSLMPSGFNHMQDLVHEQCAKQGMWYARERPFSCDVCLKILEKTKVPLPEDSNASLRCNYEALQQKHAHLHGQYSTLHKQHLAVNCLKLNAQLQHQTALRKIHENFKAFKVNLKRDLELKHGKGIGDLEDDGTNLSQLNLVVDHQFSSGTEHQEENETIDRKTDLILSHLIHEWSTENTSTEAHEGTYPQEMNEKEFQSSPERSLMPSGPNHMQDIVDVQCVKQGVWCARERPFSCDFCPKAFSAHSALVSHKRRIHNNPRPYKCEECGKKFKSRSHLIQHGRIHTGEKAYECEECGNKFSRHSYLIEHRTSHTGEKPFECEQCGKKFRVLRYLNRHRRIIHTGVFPYECETGAKPWEKQHECEECGKKFRVWHYLNDHRKTHTGVDNRRTNKQLFTCDICQKTFKHQRNVNRHKNIVHSIERQAEYKCEVWHGEMHSGVQACERGDANEHSVVQQYENEEYGAKLENKQSEPKQHADRQMDSTEHQIDDAGNQLFTCDVCQKTFKRKGSMCRHKKVVHFIEQQCMEYKCEVCDQIFMWKKSLNQHKRMFHKEEKQTITSTVYKTLEDEKSDPSNKGGQMFNTAGCKCKCLTLKTLQECKCKCKCKCTTLQMFNTQNTAGVMPYCCNVCTKPFHRSSDLKKHNIIHTRVRPYCCNVCTKSFKRCSDLKKHKKIHPGEKPYECKRCGEKFARTQDLKQHKVLHSEKRTFKCDLCPKAFRWKHALIQHRRCHTGERPYSCDVCPKAFSAYSNLCVHKRIHADEKRTQTGEKLYECEECGEKFRWKTGLQQHKAIHTGKKLPKCYICHKAFNKYSAFLVHNRIHTGERPYECEYCGKKFSMQHHRSRHRRTHTAGEAPNECGRKFKQKGNLDTHTAVHRGEKRYSCNICTNTFYSSSGLSTHKKSHTTGGYECKHCGKTYNNQYLLTHHVKMHREEKGYQGEEEMENVNEDASEPCSVGHLEEWLKRNNVVKVEGETALKEEDVLVSELAGEDTSQF